MGEGMKELLRQISGKYLNISSFYTNENWAGNTGAAGGLNSSSYESASFQSSTAGLDASSGFGGYESAYGLQGGFESAAGEVDNSYAATSSSSSEFVQTGGAALQSSSVQQSSQYASQGGLFTDPNPQVIRRAAPGGVLTYTQNIKVRFLQPPPVPPPGVNDSFLIICYH